MAYGTVKVDTIIFDQGGTDQNVTASGIYRAITSGVTVTGTISGAVLIGTTTVSGATVTGTAVQGTTVQGVSGTFTSLTGTTTTGTTANFVSGVFTTRIFGTTVTGDTGQFTSGTFVSLTGTTITGTTINAVTVSSTTGTFGSITGTTITGTTINGATVNSTTGSFTSLTGVTVTGTTAQFASGVFITQVSGLTVTGTQSSFTSGNFVTLSGATATFTSGIIASGTAAAPSLAILGDPNTGIYSPGANQLAVATNGAGRLFVGSTGNIGLSEASPTARLHIAGSTTAGGIKIVDSNSALSAPGIEVIGKRSDSNGSSGFAGKLLLSKNRTDAAINSANFLGSVAFGGNHTDGTEANILYSASIVGISDGAFNSATDMPTALVFNTGATGRAPDTANVTTGTERLRITSAGLVGIGTSAPSTILEIASNAGGQTASTIPTLRITNTDTTAVTNDIAGSVEFLSKDASEPNVVTGYIRNIAEDAGTRYALTFGAKNTGVGAQERLRIDARGRLLVGTPTSYATRNYLNNVLDPQKQLHGITSASSTAAITNWSNTTQGPAQFVLAKSRGTAVGTRGIVANTDDIGVITFTADDGANFIPAASILAEVDGIPGANDMPGRLVFSTTADGAATPTERLRITSAGLVGIGTSAPSEILDAYGSIRFGDPNTGRIYSTSGARGSIEISAPNDVINRAVSYGNNYYLDSSGTWTVASSIIGGAAIELRANNGTYGEILFRQKQDGDAGGAERIPLVITSAGLVGIGTSAPDTLLTVSQSAPTDGILAKLVNPANASGSEAGIRLQHNNTTQLQCDLVTFRSGANAGLDFNIKLSDSAGTPQTRFTILEGGNVGIGTTNPAQLFHVQSPNTNTAETIAGFGNGTIGTGLQITTNGNLDWGFNAVNSRNLTFSTNQLERARIDSGGRLLVGTSSARQSRLGTGNFQTQFQLESEDATVGLATSRFNDAAGSSFVNLQKGRGTIASPAAVIANDITGTILFSGWDGAAFTNSAFIRSEVDGTPGANDMPGRLVFSTTADGASTPTERMRIDSSGRLIRGNTASINTVNRGGSTLTPAVQQHGVDQGNATFAATNWQDSATPSYLVLGKSRGGAVGTHGAVSASSDIGFVNFTASDGTTFGSAAWMGCYAAATTSAGSTPGYLAFATSDAGATSPTERMRIRSDGNIGIGTAGSATVTFYNRGPITGSTTAYANFTNATVQSDVTTATFVNRTSINTAAAAFATTVYHYSAALATLGAGSAITNNIGFYAEGNLGSISAAQVTSAYGFRGDIASAAGRWNFYTAGTAPNYFSGDVRTNKAVTKRQAPTNSNTTATVATAASLIDGLRTSTPTADITLLVPTGTSMDAAFQELQNHQSFEWSLINLATAASGFDVTVTANTTHTVVGRMVVTGETSGRFLTRKTAANTFITYRIA